MKKIVEKYERLMAWWNDHKAELQTQPAMVAAIKADYEVERLVYDLYFAMYNKSLGGCGSCLADALILLLMKDVKQRMKEIEACQFQLRNGALLQDTFGKLPMATAANLTDEIAIAYLRDNIARKRLFKVLPENLEELLKGETKEPAKPAEEPKPKEGAKEPAHSDAKPEGEQVPTEEAKEPENGEKRDEGEELTAEQINAMSYNELKSEVARRGIKVGKATKAALLDALLATL